MANLSIQMPLIQAIGQGNQGYAELQSPFILAQSGRPVILLSSGTFADSTGLMTGLTALPYVPTGIVQVFIFAGAGIPASGLYWAIFSSTTSCQLYTRFDGTNPPTGITPGAYAGGTSEVTLSSLLIPGGILGRNGSLYSDPFPQANNSVNAKTLRTKLSTITFSALNLGNAAADGRPWRLQAANSLSSQVSSGLIGYTGGSASTPTVAVIDMSVDQTLVITGQLSVATDWLMITRQHVLVFPSNP